MVKSKRQIKMTNRNLDTSKNIVPTKVKDIKKGNSMKNYRTSIESHLPKHKRPSVRAKNERDKVKAEIAFNQQKKKEEKRKRLEAKNEM